MHKKDSKATGLILFEEVRQAFRAEAILKKAGYEIKLVVPPPEFRSGCDLAIEFNINERVGVERVLRSSNVNFTNIVPLTASTRDALEIVKCVEFGDSVMVRCGALKITFDKKTGLIHNISGGGCPDIPYLYSELVGKKITDAPRPKDIGYSLCALCLDRAFEEGLKIFESTHSRHGSN